MKEQQNNSVFTEYSLKAHEILNQYNEKIEKIRKQKTEAGLLKGRASFPEERTLRKECDEKIKELAEKYRIKSTS